MWDLASPKLCQILGCCIRASLTQAQMSASLCTGYQRSCLAIGRIPIMTGSCFVTTHLYPGTLTFPTRLGSILCSHSGLQVKLVTNPLQYGSPVARLSVILVQSRNRSLELRHGVCRYLETRGHQTNTHSITDAAERKSQEHQSKGFTTFALVTIWYD